MICVLIAAVIAGGEDFPKSRDPWKWPFATDSIWNLPLGSGAVYVPAGLTPAPHIGIDVEYMVVTKAGDPTLPVYPPSEWNKRWPGDSSRKLGELIVPKDFVIEDAKSGSTPNACSAILMPDGRTVKQLEPTCRLPGSDHIVGWMREDQDLFGTGIFGTHWGSGLSTLGGSIRKGELTGADPIRHAIKLNVFGDRLYYGSDVKGFRWPADRADEYAAKSYQGKNPRLVMGTLLGLDPKIKIDSLGLKTAPAKKLFRALQDYGAYISDDSGWDHYDLCMEVGVADEVKASTGVEIGFSEGVVRDDMMAIITRLSIIENNSPSRVGGGGIRRRPLAPMIRPTR